MNIVISGAGKGIGFELTKIFAENGHNIIAISRNISKLNDLTFKNLKAISFDLTTGNYEELLTNIKQFFPNIDVLINNAGLLINKPFTEFTDDDFDNIFRTNVNSIAKLSRTLINDLSENSHIVNISSMGGFQGSSKFPGLSLYAASKGAVSILTEAMAEELKERGISVNALALGAVQTEMLAEAFPGFKAPLKAEEMAEYIFNFALRGNKFYNGKILPVASTTP